MAGLSFRETVRSFNAGGSRIAAPLCLKEVRWFGYLIKIPPGCLPLEVFWAVSNWEETSGETQN